MNKYNNVMAAGQLVLNDSGAESPRHYASDITRTFPVNGKFTDLQKKIYNIVYEMQAAAFTFCAPGKSYKEAHLKAASIAVEGLKKLGIMKRRWGRRGGSGGPRLILSPWSRPHAGDWMS